MQTTEWREWEVGGLISITFFSSSSLFLSPNEFDGVKLQINKDLKNVILLTTNCG
jgi:hypothetical protein